MTEAIDGVKASLFVTCVIDQFFPEVGESTVRVLRRLGVDVDFPAGQTCCGQPAFNSGYWSDAKPLARRFLETFAGAAYVVTPSGSCASMARVFYEELLHDDTDLLEAARAMAPRVFELSEFIVDILGVTDIPAKTAPGGASGSRKITYHESCHLRRELGATTQARTLIEALPDVELIAMEQADECCGFGGTFAVKYADISGAMLRRKIENIRATNSEYVVACDSSCLMQIGGGLQKQDVGSRPLHLAQLLDQGLPAGRE